MTKARIGAIVLAIEASVEPSRDRRRGLTQTPEAAACCADTIGA
jgi:hypothetical protein